MAVADRQMLGVLGGMGPLATVDFLEKLIKATPASCDQDHIPMMVCFSTNTPDRSNALSGEGPSPLPSLLEAARVIERAGAQGLVIPCNTAHAWFPDLSNAVKIPILHIVDAAIEQLPPEVLEFPIGLIATSGTLNSRIYELRHPEIQWTLPSSREMEQWVMPAIRLVKRGELVQAEQLLEQAINALADRGARAIVLGCTELPLASPSKPLALPLIDATEALAKMAVRWATRGGGSSNLDCQ